MDPVADPFIAFVRIPPCIFIRGVAMNLAPIAPRMESNEDWGMAVSAAAPSSISVRYPRSIASF